MTHEADFFMSGAVLGLAAGISPGPLLTLVVSETLKYGKWEGIKVALSPILSDLPIILFVTLLSSIATGANELIGFLSLLGAAYLVYLGMENFRDTATEFSCETSTRDSLTKGVIANVLSPHAYMFWLSIGLPSIYKGLKFGVMPAVLFFVGFYMLLSGSKIVLAILLGEYRDLLNSKCYFFILRGLGCCLIIFGLLFAFEGLRLLGVAEIF